MEENRELTGEIRDEQGKFKPGVSGNPEGRPKGAGISITTAIKRELEKCPQGQKATYLDLIVKRILKKAIEEGDQQMIKQVWNYIDGMPRQNIGLDGGKEGAPIMFLPTEVLEKNEIPSSSKPDSE